MTVDAKLAAALPFISPAADPDILPLPVPAPASVTIAGEATATEEQMLAYLLRRNPKPKLTGTPEELVHTYYEEAEHEGVRPDLALAQAFKETGFFAYGGDVDWRQNNFCGLGATGNGAKGLSFPDIRTGARAHIQHLLAYSRKERPTKPIVDPRYDLIRTNRPDIYGRLTHWTDLNGVWAVPGKNYGQEIIVIRDRARQPDGSDASLASEVYLKIAPDDAAALHNYGLALLAENNPAKAAAALRDAIRRAPTNANSYSALAVALIRTKDYTGAWNTLANGAAIAPANTDILINQILLQACLKDAGDKKYKKK